MRSITAADPKARADIEDNFCKTIGQLIGGAAVLIGAGLAYLQFTQQQQASRDLLISNQVAKGFEQFASKEIVMRLGELRLVPEPNLYCRRVMKAKSRVSYASSVLRSALASFRSGVSKPSVNQP
jgi:hypothetical protein